METAPTCESLLGESLPGQPLGNSSRGLNSSPQLIHIVIILATTEISDEGDHENIMSLCLQRPTTRGSWTEEKQGAVSIGGESDA